MDGFLKKAGFAQLYPKDKRDAVILHAAAHGASLMDLNSTLYSMDMETLF